MADLIDLDVRPQRVWGPSDFGALFLHELDTPLGVELDGIGQAATSDGRVGVLGTGRMTVGQLLHHSAPPLDLLVRLKDLAKRARHDPQSHLPEDVAAALYAAAIAAALLRHGRRITAMSSAALSTHLAWAAKRPWLDPATRDILAEALGTISAPSDHTAAS
jgi:hypothetical protein